METDILLIGGYDLAKDSVSDVVFRLDIRNLTWHVLTEIPRGNTIDCGAICVGQFVYVLGGHGISNEFTGSCERFDAKTQEWKNDVAQLDGPCFVNGLIKSNKQENSIVASVDTVRLENEGAVLDKQSRFEQLSVQNQTCVQQQQLDMGYSKRCELPIASVLDGIYACGGFEISGEAAAKMEVFVESSKNSHWVQASSMAVPRGSHCLVSSNAAQTLFALGGTWLSGGRSSFRICEKYDAGINRWSIIKPMSKARRNFSAVNRNGQIYVFGGFDAAGDGILFDCEMFDQRAGVWMKRPDVPGVLWNYVVAA